MQTAPIYKHIYQHLDVYIQINMYSPTSESKHIITSLHKHIDMSLHKHLYDAITQTAHIYHHLDVYIRINMHSPTSERKHTDIIGYQFLALSVVLKSFCQQEFWEKRS